MITPEIEKELNLICHWIETERIRTIFILEWWRAFRDAYED